MLTQSHDFQRRCGAACSACSHGGRATPMSSGLHTLLTRLGIAAAHAGEAASVRAFLRTGLALALLSSSLLGTVATADSSTARPAALVSDSYVIQPGDQLMITVWKETELQGEVLVRPDGGLTFPLAGEIEAAGHTVAEVRQAIQSHLLKYIPDPVVTVAVKAATGSRIFVVGRV